MAQTRMLNMDRLRRIRRRGFRATAAIFLKRADNQLRFYIGRSRTVDAVHSAIGLLRLRRNYVRRMWPGRDPNHASTHEAVYLHFDPHGTVHEYVLVQLRELVATGFRVTFVSNAPKFDDDAVFAVAPLCRQIIWRWNIGYDFGGYKDGIRALGDIARIERLLLMNDSVYGPFYPLAQVLEQLEPARADVWGITDSWEYDHHIQSYFIVFSKAALSSPAFTTFWDGLPYVNYKNWVIRHGEVGLTQALTAAKLRARVLNPYWHVAGAILDKIEQGRCVATAEHESFFDELHVNLAQGRPLNPAHYFCETLLTDFRCPFLKRDVITRNPRNSPFVRNWPDIIGRTGSYDLDLIHRHLRRI